MEFFIKKRVQRHAYCPRHFDRSQYSLDGVRYYPKSRFLPVVVKKILKEYPNTTLQQLEHILPERARYAKTIQSLSEWKMLNSDMQDRYNHDVDDILQDVNGEKFLLTTQCTKEFFDSEIVPLLERRFGWEVYVQAR